MFDETIAEVSDESEDLNEEQQDDTPKGIKRKPFEAKLAQAQAKLEMMF